MDIRTMISALLLASGAIFLWIAAVGVVKFPDFYTRLHAAGIGDTLGAFLLTLGIMVKTGFSILSLKVLLVYLFYLFTNPLGTNLIILGAIHARDYQGYTKKRVLVSRNDNIDNREHNNEDIPKYEAGEDVAENFRVEHNEPNEKENTSVNSNSEKDPENNSTEESPEEMNREEMQRKGENTDVHIDA